MAGLGRVALVVGVTFSFALALTGILGPTIFTFEPNLSDLQSRNVPPGTANHFLGTDNIGRDLLSRLIVGLRLDAYVGIFGFLVGSLSGWLLVLWNSKRSPSGFRKLPHYSRTLLLRVAGLALLPGVFLLFPFVILFGQSATLIFVWAGVLSSLIPMVLVYRTIKKHSHSISPVPSSFRIIVKMSPIGFSLALLMGLFVESLASFLGVGMPALTPSLGGIIAGGREFIPAAWWIAFYPSLILLISIGAFVGISTQISAPLLDSKSHGSGTAEP